ncbi:MAG TPA: class III signal peptide-containing protein [Methanobacterium sp.]|jgi:uncharacterized protein (UPF0333 family)|nr:MAG: class III signal peptide-containing protein [Methanobacterium sp.]HOI71456.1 class III signal peptide-containing protein [Methanobacterium sp.]
MDSRGQVSAEYIFLILIFLIVLATVTVPFAGDAITSSQNVSVASDAKVALSAITNAVNVVYSNGPGAKRTVNVYFPQDARLAYDGTNKALTLGLQDIPVSASDPSGDQKGNVQASVPYTVNVDETVTKGWHDVVITWDVGDKFITVTVQ